MSIKWKKALEGSIISSLGYILSHQSKDGSWMDCQFPPGPSDAWATAYVGYRLKRVPKRLRSRVARSTFSASKWLKRNEYADAGWGYNRVSGSDADSTAWAILLLVSEGEKVSIRSYRHLMEFQSADGGFSFYLPTSRADSWRISHPDITPVALEALLTRYNRENPHIKKGLEYVLKHRTSDGLWNSFWWDSFLYGTEANLSFLDTIGALFGKEKTVESLLRVSPKNAFESALLILCILYTSAESKARVFELADQLIQEQETDGSWKNAPIIRLTENDCFEPWAVKDSGRLYTDSRRLITTSTILESLCKVYVKT